MGKNENISFSVPDAPPGFPLLNNSKAASSPAVEEIKSGHMHEQNHDSNSRREQLNVNAINVQSATGELTPPKQVYVLPTAPVVLTRRRGRPCKARSVQSDYTSVRSGHMHEQNHDSSSRREQPNVNTINLRRTTRIITPPKELYVPLTAPVVPTGRRGRSRKARSVQSKNTSLQEDVTISPDKVLSTPSTRPQEPSPCNTIAPHIAENCSGAKQKVEETSRVDITPSTYHQQEQNTSSKRKRDDIYVDKHPANRTHASMLRDHDIERTNSPTSGNHTTKNLGLDNQQSQSIDSDILQQVESDQNQLALDGPIIKSRSSGLDVNLNKILSAVNLKYGDITRNCPLESDNVKKFVSLSICQVVQDLQNKRLKDGDDIHILDSYYKVVRDAEKLKVDVQWLHNRLDEIKDAFRATHEAKRIEAERNKLVKNMAMKKKDLVLRQVELKRLECEIQDIQDQLNRETVMVKELNRNLGAEESKFSRFQQDSSFTTGLI